MSFPTSCDCVFVVCDGKENTLNSFGKSSICLLLSLEVTLFCLVLPSGGTEPNFLSLLFYFNLPDTAPLT